MVAEVVHKNDLLDQVFRTAVQHAERNKKSMHAVSDCVRFFMQLSTEEN
jgi:hypothetical protein